MAAITDRAKRLLISGGVVALLVFGIPATQKGCYHRREAALQRLPRGATKAQVVELFGQPDQMIGDSWYYDATPIGGLSLWHSDDMRIIFENDKVEDGFLTPP